MSHEELLSAEQAAEAYALSPWTIRAWWSTGRLARYKLGRLSRARRADIEALIGLHTAQQQADPPRQPEHLRRPRASEAGR